MSVIEDYAIEKLIDTEWFWIEVDRNRMSEEEFEYYYPEEELKEYEFDKRNG